MINWWLMSWIVLWAIGMCQILFQVYYREKTPLYFISACFGFFLLYMGGAFDTLFY